MSHLIKPNITQSLVKIFRQKLVSNLRLLSTLSLNNITSNLITVQKDKEVELMDKEEREHKNKLSKTTLTTDQPMDITDINGVPEEHVYGRRVRISQPTKNAMQSGGYGHSKWKIEFENRERWENPLMGWTSTGDPLSNLNVYFSTKEEAADFCDKNGWYYEITEPQQRKQLNKNYSENFSWNKRTRIGSK